MDTSDKTIKLLSKILNKVFCLYNVREYRKYFIERNLYIENLIKRYIIYYKDENKYSSNMYYHYYIFLSVNHD